MDTIIGEEEIVWHYTTIDTACKILEGNNMRATYYTGLNDSLDVKYGFDIALKILKKMGLQDAIFKCLEGILEDVVKARYPSLWYIMCFSHDGDSIAQWQGYTDSFNGGCAIGFKKTELSNLFSDTGEKPADHSFFPREINCIYDKTDIEQRIKNILNKSKLTQKIIQDYKNADGAEILLDPIKGIHAVGTRVEIANIALGAKHNGFAHEKEFRLAFESDERHPVHLNESFSRRYITCSFNSSKLNTIQYVRLSPHGNIERNRLCVENVLALHPEYQIKILESDMPYRGKML